jgi:hypothetical protein
MMDAILFSADPRKVDVEDAIKHLSKHKQLYWSVGYPIVKSGFKFPIVGFIHIKGREVEYKAIIEDNIPFSSDHFDDPLAERVKPKTFRQDWENDPKEGLRRSKTVLIMTKLRPFSFKTLSFRLHNGHWIKVPPQRYAGVIPPRGALSAPDSARNRRQKARKTTSPGANVTFTKDGHSANPQHAKIVKALAKALTKHGLNLEHQFKCNPDVLATKHRERLLFEIKPDSSKASFYMGLGQLLLYRRDVHECQSFLVVPEDSISEDWLTEEWRTEFKERKIGFVTYKKRENQYYFPRLAVQLRA